MQKKLLQWLLCILFVNTTIAQPADFTPGATVIFEDQFAQDPLGDLPAKWSTSGDGEVVAIGRMPGKWFKITQPTAVSPELSEALPENCTIEFDLHLRNTSGVAPVVMFGLTTLSDVAAGDVYRNHIWVALRGYNEGGEVNYGKQIQDLGQKNFKLSGYVGRKLHVSISINKTRFRVWLDKTKLVDLPKLLTDEYRNNFFIASSTVIPSPEEGVYFSNVKIASGDEDARSMLIRQLLEQGGVVTSDINFDTQTNEVTPESQGLLDTLGQALLNDPSLNIQINGAELSAEGNSAEKLARKKVEKMKNYLIQKFDLSTDRILTEASQKVRSKLDEMKNSKSGTKIKGFLTEIIKL